MSYPIIDCHADTFSKMLLQKRSNRLFKGFAMQPPNYLQHRDITAKRTTKANLRIQTQSLYIGDSLLDKPLTHALEISAIALQFIEENKDFYLVKSFDEEKFQSKYGILLSIEGLEIIENSLDLLDIFHNLGIRMIAPSWNRISKWFTPITESGGMLSHGKELIDKLNTMKVLLDISHLSDQSVLDLEKHYQGTIIASHSNIRAINSSARNLPNDLIEIIKERNGLIGVNIYYGFLRSDRTEHQGFKFHDQVNYNYEYELSDISDTYPIGFLWVLELLEYYDKINALDNVCFGSDFDGIHKYCAGLENPTGFPLLEDFLRKASVSEEVIAKLFYKNALRVLKTVL
jgi:membrane dipeptidase